MTEDLTGELHQLNDQLGELRRDIARDYEPRAEQRRRRRQTVIAVVIAVLLALTIENAAISECFLGPPTGLERRLCGYAFPGSEQARRQSDVRLHQFLDILEAIPTNTARSQDNQRRIEDLTRRVQQLERKARR